MIDLLLTVVSGLIATLVLWGISKLIKNNTSRVLLRRQYAAEMDYRHNIDVYIGRSEGDFTFKKYTETKGFLWGGVIEYDGTKNKDNNKAYELHDIDGINRGCDQK